MRDKSSHKGVNGTVEAELRQRLAALEEWKGDVRQKLHSATWVAVALGLAGIWGGSYVSTLGQRLADSADKTARLESQVDRLEQAVRDAERQLSSTSEDVKAELTTWSQLKLVDMQTAIDTSAAARLQEISRAGVSDVIDTLQSGSVALKVRELVVGSANSRAVVLGADAEGAGYVHVNGKDQNLRFAVTFRDDNARATFFNSMNARALELGASRDEGEGFVGVVNNSGEGWAAMLSQENDEGSVRLFAGGSLVAFAGASSVGASKGNGLVFVSSPDGEVVASLRAEPAGQPSR